MEVWEGLLIILATIIVCVYLFKDLFKIKDGGSLKKNTKYINNNSIF